MPNEDMRRNVQERYARAARAAGQAGASCCGGGVPTDDPGPITRDLYAPAEAAAVPAEALRASLGCGNPTALADLRPGETVLDLGSGGGIDVLLSARRVGPSGKAYGLDMTPEMLALARENQRKAGVANAEFLHGTIESIPLPDRSVDVIVSNCVINLSTDKDAVLREACRVLKPGGRLAVSDIVLRRPLPAALQSVVALWTGCVAGALLESEYRAKLAAAGFVDVSVEPTRIYSRADAEGVVASLRAESGGCCAGTPGAVLPAGTLEAADGAVMSAFVRARKP